MQKNKDITIRGLFRLVMLQRHRDKLKHPEQKYFTSKNDKRNYKKRKKSGYFTKNKQIKTDEKNH